MEVLDSGGRNIVLILALVLASVCYGQTQAYFEGDELNVNSLSGLNLRESPGVKSAKVHLLSYGDSVTALENENVSSETVINGIKGCWVKVKFDTISGYVFDAYLTDLPVINSYASEYCVFESMKEYALNNFEVLDSVKYHNGSSGESFHLMTIYQFDLGIQFIEHTYWESQAVELQFENTRDVEGVNFVKALLNGCELLDQKLENEITELGFYHVKLEKLWCDIKIFRYENKLIVKFLKGL